MKNQSSGLSGFLSSITIILSTPCAFSHSRHSLYIIEATNAHALLIVLMAGIVGVILNIVLPRDSNDSEPLLVEDSDLEGQKESESVSGSTSKG